MKQLKHLWITVPLLASGIAFSGISSVLAAQQNQQQNNVRLRVARFWRGEGRTLLQGVVGLPLATENRSVELSVRDSAGRVLHTESWSDTARLSAIPLAGANIETTTTLESILMPGVYTVAARTTQVTRADSAVVNVRAFPEAPLVSDLLVSARMRALQQGETPDASEMRLGRYAIERGVTVTVLPTEPRLWYYLELYGAGADSIADVQFRVIPDGSDSALVRINRKVRATPRGTIDAAAMVVQGLPPANYRLVVTARNGSREEQREARFTMASYETVAPAPVAPGGGVSEATLYERYFTTSNRTDGDINNLVESVIVAAPADAVPSSIGQMANDAKRRYLARYFSRIADPNPSTPNHELFEEYDQRVRHVFRNYGEQRGRPAVRTDRGRIYLKYGPPDAQQLAPMTGNRALELWKYTKRRPLKFAFVDETGFQNFNLVYTTDPNEVSMQDWMERVGDRETIRLILNF